MTVAEVEDLDQDKLERSTLNHSPARRGGFPWSAQRQHTLLMVVAWVCVAILLGWFYIRPVYRAGLDARQGFWEYWESNRFISDIQNAMTQGSMVLREAEAVATADEKKLTPAEREARDKANAGRPMATIAKPGPGLFDRPWSPSIFVQRWRHLYPVYSQLYRGWVQTYETLQNGNPSGEYDLDYPPLRLFTMTLWMWKVQAAYPGLDQFPRERMRFFDPETNKPVWASPEIARPLLRMNTFCDLVSSVCAFFLVWVWVERRPKALKPLNWMWWRKNSPTPGLRYSEDPGLRSTSDTGVWGIPRNWRFRWGDRILLLPVILLGIATLLRPLVTFTMSGLPAPADSLIDQRIVSMGWWLFLVLRFTSVVALARFLPSPFRGAVCGAIAATMIWLNPASILDSMGWPQWEVWLPPWFLMAALLVSLDWWITAGLVLGIGCMFKGQLLFVAPLFSLCPLFAGWIGKFMRIVAGLGIGMAIVVWPWMVPNASAKAYIVSVVFAAGLVCMVSIYRRPIWSSIVSAVRGIGVRVQHWRAGRAFAIDRSGPSAHDDSSPYKWQTLVMIASVVLMLSFRLEPAKLRWWIVAVGASGLIATWRQTLRHLPWIAIATACVFAAILVRQLRWTQPDYLNPWTTALAAAVVILPWFIPRRMIAGWVAFAFAASIWLGALSLSGSFSWWEVGFMYGTRKHDTMQLGSRSLSNLSSLLQQRYRWDLHDLAATISGGPISIGRTVIVTFLASAALLISGVGVAAYLRRRQIRFIVAAATTWVVCGVIMLLLRPQYSFGPLFAPAELELRSLMATMYFITLVVIAAAAAVHLRRRDRRFLLTLIAPWMCFVALLPQLAARYTLFPAILAAVLVAVSVPMSMFQFLLTTIACMMLGNQMIMSNPQIAPITMQLTRPTFPDFGWAMLVLALLMIVGSMVQTPRGKDLPEVVAA